MVKCSSDTDKAHISESSATVIAVLLLLQYHCPPNLELHQHVSSACAGQFLVVIKYTKNHLKQGIASDTIPSHCTILLTGLIAGWILIS